ncbi:MAG TPA: translocation/assembly module TamB domain-containing protein, partial [Bacteroidota bacterium]
AGFDLTKFMFESQKLADVNLRVFADSGTVQAHLRHGPARMDANAMLGPDSALSGAFALNVPSLKEFGEMLRGSHLDGSLAARGSIGGNLRQPVVDATLTGAEIRYRNFPVDSLMADVRAGGRSVVIRSASIAGRWSGRGAEEAPFGLDSLRGTLAYRGTLSGTPKALKGRFVMLASGMAYERYHIDSLRLAASIDSSMIRLEEAMLRNDTLALRLTGAYDLAARDGELQGGLQPTAMLQAGGADGRQGGRIDAVARLLAGGLRGHLQLDDVDLASLLSLVQDSVRVGGRASINADIGGDKKNPDADFTLLVRDPVYADFRLDSIFVKGGLHNGLAALQTMSLGGRGQSVQGKASIKLERDSAGMLTVGERSATSGSIETKSLNLRSVQSMIKTNKGLSGTASLALHWDGTVGSPSLHGTLAIDTLHAVPNERVGPVAFSMRGSIDGRTFVVDTASGTLLNRPFSLRGKLTAESLSQFAADIAFRVADSSLISGRGTIARDRYDLKVLIDRFDLAVAQPFVPSLKRLEGVLNGKIQLAGSPQAPRTQGTLDVSRLTVQPALLDSPLTGGLARLRFDGNTVHVDSVFIRSAEGGYVLTTGSVALANNKPQQMNFKTVIRKFAVSSEDNFKARVDSAEITVRTKGEQMVVDGDLVLGESRLTRNVDPGLIFGGNPKVQRVAAPGAATAAGAQGTLLNLRIHRSDSVWIDNNLAKMRFDIEMAVRGSTGKPIPAGKVGIPEGKLIYLDRDFTVKQGDIYFADPNKINPEIHFQAESQVEDYQGMNASTYVITISAQGLLNQLDIQLTSDPQLDKPDIVALLTLGATRNELSGGGTQGSGTGGVVADRAKQLASEKLGSTIGNAAGKLLGLDQVSLSGNIFNPSEGGGPELMVSKRVSKKAKVSYSTNVGHMNDQSIRLDYELTKIWSLSGETTQGGNTQFGFQYKLVFP